MLDALIELNSKFLMNNYGSEFTILFSRQDFYKLLYELKQIQHYTMGLNYFYDVESFKIAGPGGYITVGIKPNED